MRGRPGTVSNDNNSVASAFFCGLLLAGALLGDSLAAQGPITRERWTHAELEALRRTLADACQGADPELLAAVAGDLVTPTAGNPFTPPLAALARLRGVDPDPAFLYRGNLCAFASPEVVDPDGSNEVCRDLNVTFYLPHRIEDPIGAHGEVRLQVTVRNSAGDAVWEGTVKENTTIDDLLRYRPVCQIPGASLPDGSYTLTALAWLDGAAPRPRDPVTGCRFSVLRGYQERAERLFSDRLPALSEDPDLPALSRAIVRGAVTQVARVYAAEPAAGRSRALVDLGVAEQVADNLSRGAAPLTGLSGRVDVAVPTGLDDEIAFVTLSLPAADADPKPLVLFLPGGPAQDHESGRPASPTTTSPGWWADLLIDRGFGAEGRWNWAVMESPGRVSSSLTALRGVLAALTGLLDVPEGQVCVVAERQGAWVASHGLNGPGLDVAGLVLMVNGGNLPLAELEKRDLQVLGIPAFGPVSSLALQRLTARDTSGRLRMLDGTSRPWPVVLALSLPEIEAFIGQLRWER